MELFESLYRNHKDGVYGFLLRQTGYDAALAEELTQETFYQAFCSFDQFRGDCLIFTWLCQIAKHLLSRYRRKNRMQTAVGEPPVPQLADENVQKAVEDVELRRFILRTIDAMGEHYRSVLSYRLYTQMKNAEIAALLSLSESSVKVLFYRGRLMLKKAIEEEFQ